jgi:Synergist-CTERM protein sorting domain-containing protein
VALNQDFPAYRYMGDRSVLKTYFAGDINMLPFVSGTNVEFPLLLTQEEKAQYTSGALANDIELLAFSSFTVNKHAGIFRAYLKKTEKAGDWYTWDWATGKAVKITPESDGYANVMMENIGPGNEVILFKVSEKKSVLPPCLEEVGCNAGYFAFALFMLIPLIIKRRSK